MKNSKIKTKHDLTNIRIVLDRSGSMAGSESVTTKALNAYLTDLKSEDGVNDV